MRVSAAPAEVGKAALESNVVLTDLRDGGAGLEDIFLQLTAATQREQVAPIQAEGASA